MKKKLNPFAAFLSRNFMFGGMVNMDAPDEPGGMQGAEGGEGDEGSGVGAGGGMGGSADDAGNSDSGGDDSSSADASGDGDGKPGEGEGTGSEGDNAPDYEKRFTALDTKINNMLTLLNSGTSNSDDDGQSQGDTGGFNLEHDDLVAMMADDPEGFIGKLTHSIEQQVTNKVMQENADNAFSGAVEKTIDEYADANEDFEPMWVDGSIKDYMDKNVGHNAISAHMALTMEQRLADARKEGADEAIKNFRAKSNSQVLNDGPGIPPDQRDAALKEPGKFGGRAAVVAARAGIQ